MCTAMYAVGDRCRQFARCAIIDGRCQLVKDEQLEACQSCLQLCLARSGGDPLRAASCDTTCAS